MPADPPAPSAPILYEDSALLFQDGFIGPVGVIAANNSVNFVTGGSSINTGSSGLNLPRGGDFTIDLFGPKIPFQLQVDIDDLGSLRTDTYNMGPSNTSQRITTTVDEIITDVRAARRF